MGPERTVFYIVLLLLLCRATSGQIEKVCTKAQAEEQANKFFQKYHPSQNTGWASCGGKQWLTRLHELAPAGERHLIDIGCNKGYESGLFFDLLVPEVKLTPENMHKLHKEDQQGLTGDLCGACGNCKEKAKRGSLNDSSKHKSVHVYCFEPSLRNFWAILSVEKRYNEVLTKHRTKWNVYNAAVSNFTGVTTFPRSCGSTLCSFHNQDQGPLDVVFVITVDDFLQQAGLNHIDVLKIDTEGNDPAVLFGASEAIKKQNIDILYFEYHGIGLWRTVTLKSIVSWFAGFDYVCYLEGTPTLTRLTGCWSNRYEFKSWSNVVCTPSKSYLFASLERLTFLAPVSN